MAQIKSNNFTEGPLYGPMIRFLLPVLLALFLQAMYGAVDLLVVGHFATKADISAVSTGSQLLHALTMLVSSLAMGTTIRIGQQIGMGRLQESGRTIGASICLFAVIGIVISVLMVTFALPLSHLMNAPEEALTMTCDYIRICGMGMVVVTAYNLIGSIFRGIGDSRTPFITVLIACICNIFGDLLFVAVFHMGAAGAATATVLSQGISVVLSVLIIRKRTLPFAFERSYIRFDRQIIGSITRLGLPIAIQDLLVHVSFLLMLIIVNGLGVTASAGMGVAEKNIAFIMLVPSAFMQSISAIVAQNFGAGKYDRAERALKQAILTSSVISLFMFWLSFFHGDFLAGIFAGHKPEVVEAAADYLKAYAIDCLLTPIFFCFTGFYNGLGLTKYVMIQGIVSAFGVRIPVAWLMSKRVPVSMFHIGLATPASSLLQIVMGLLCLIYVKKVFYPRHQSLTSS